MKSRLLHKSNYTNAGDVHCQYEFDCICPARFKFISDFEEVDLCSEHYIKELELTVRLYEEKYGTFCMECGDLPPREVVEDPTMPCLCERHLKELKKAKKLLPVLVKYWDEHDEEEKDKILKYMNS